jgi:3-oxoacyl-[acyl-carrier-protein] synthase-3
MLPVKIAGLGTYLPEQRISNAQLERELGLNPGWIERATGVVERRRAGRETVVDMAAAAARMALRNADLSPHSIDYVIGASSSPLQAIPCTAAFVHRALELPQGRSACFDVNATCVSFLVGLHTAAQLIAAGANSVLIFSSEKTSFTLNHNEPESAVLMGDGAAAAVIVPAIPHEASSLHLARFVTHSSGVRLTEARGGGTLHHPNDPATTREMNTFHMDGPGVFKLVLRHLGPFIEQFLADVGWSRADVDLLVPHQASGPGVRLLTHRYGFNPEQVFLNLPTRGNCIAASLPIALSEAVEAGRVQRGQRLMLLGTGAGLTLAAIALTF